VFARGSVDGSTAAGGNVVLRGGEAAIVWGYRTAAVCRSWTARRTPAGRWTLSAVLTRSDPFILRQPDLKFTAARRGGFFCWPVLHVVQTAPTLAAVLGPPES
jgi:hypothetical protein